MRMLRNRTDSAMDVVQTVCEKFRAGMRPGEDKAREVRLQHVAIEREIDADMSNITAQDHISATRAGALAILDGVETTAVATATAVRESLPAKYQRRAELRAAIEEQERRNAETRARLSQRACEEARPAWVALVRDYAEALAEAGRTAAKLRQFRKSLEDAGISCSHLGNGITGADSMDISEMHSRVNVWLDGIERDYNITVDREPGA